MIKTIRAINFVEDKFEYVMGDPNPSHGMIVKDIDGLGPAKADINMTDISTSDGSVYNSARVQKRNIVITFLLVGTPDAEKARLNSYKFFPIKKNLYFEIETENRHVYTYGYVESNDPVIFSKENETKISIVCPNPFFFDFEGQSIESFSGIESKFYFPFSNVVSAETYDQKTLSFGDINTDRHRSLVYKGDSTIGVTINVYANGAFTNPSFTNATTQQTINIDTTKLASLMGGTAIQAGDRILINTSTGNKSAYLIRNNTQTNILNTLDRYTDWIILQKGYNEFTYSADSGVDNMYITISNDVLYEGV